MLLNVSGVLNAMWQVTDVLRGSEVLGLIMLEWMTTQEDTKIPGIYFKPGVKFLGT